MANVCCFQSTKYAHGLFMNQHKTYSMQFRLQCYSWYYISILYLFGSYTKCITQRMIHDQKSVSWYIVIIIVTVWGPRAQIIVTLREHTYSSKANVTNSMIKQHPSTVINSWIVNHNIVANNIHFYSVFSVYIVKNV